MSRMRIYTVHIDPSLPHPYEEARFVKEGFSWPGFFFLGLWALYNRLWWVAIGIIAVNGFMWHLVQEKELTHSAYLILHFTLHLMVGFYGNDWLRNRLARRGYLTVDITAGDSPLRAEQRFFDRYLAANPAAAA
jgi:hypothetical protein